MQEKTFTTLRDRISYSPIGQRAPFTLPNNARVAVWTIVNIENWDPAGMMPRTVLPPPMGQTRLPDVPNWCWHEYGMRVGYWRFIEVMKKYQIPVTLALNGTTCLEYPQACEAALELGWEFMGHGWVQQPMHVVEDPRSAIAKTIEQIRAFTGKNPIGWESPGIAETMDTLDYLAEAGIRYVADWVLDDQPVALKTRHGRMVSVPYTVEINDVVMSAIQQQPSQEIYTRGKDHFDQLYAEGATIPRVMAISIHPYLTGAPHRIKYLAQLYEHILSHPDVILCQGQDIYQLFEQQFPVTPQET